MSNKIKCLDENYSTTRLCYKLIDDEYLDENGKLKENYKFKLKFPEFGIIDSKIPAKEGEKFNTYLFLPEGEGRKGEGGLRTKGYFKFSYIWNEEKWWIVDFDGNPIKSAPEEIQRSIHAYMNAISSENQPTESDISKSIIQNTIQNNNLTSNIQHPRFNKLPLITVITVVFNGEKYLEQTIQSVINQTYPNVEYIIIDGGSTDGTLDIIKKYEDYIDYWVSEKDKGIYDAMNKGITLAMGNIIGIINSDDWYSFNALNLIYHAYMSISQKIGILHGDMNLIKDENKFFILRPYRNLKKIKKGMIINHPTVFVSRKIYLENGFFDINYKIVADWELMLRFYLHGIKFYKINTVLANFRIGGLSYNYNKKHIYEKHIVRKKYNLFKIVDTLYIYDLIKYYIFGNFISRLSLFKKYLLSKFQ